MATATQQKTDTPNRASAKRTNSAAAKRKSPSRAKSRGQDTPPWLTAAVSIIGVGVAVGAGLYATRKQWMAKADEWRDDFSAAFADDETDYENFDQTRNAGADSMRDHPGENWEDIDDMSDASFPASDPPSFNPGKA